MSYFFIHVRTSGAGVPSNEFDGTEVC